MERRRVSMAPALYHRSLNLKILIAAVLPAVGLAATTVLFDPSSPATGPFPTDFLTIADTAQRTGLRLNLPVPDCGAQQTACQEFALLNQTDGFSLRPRIAVHFSSPVDTATLRAGIFFVALDGVARMPINQVVYDPATNTVYAKPDNVLDQQSRYALIVTDAVKDAAGAPVVADSAFTACLQSRNGYCAGLAAALAPIAPDRIVAASVFTTLSATSWIERARAILPNVPAVAKPPAPQTSFAIADVAGITLHNQTGANPVRFSDLTLPLDPALLAGIDRVVIGSYRSPRFLDAAQTIGPSSSGPPLAVPTTTEEIGFNAFLPTAVKPAAGYPVVIFGHGFGDSRFGGPTAVAPALARAGFAVIAIDAAGHGFGPFSTVIFTDRSGRQTTVPALGRSVDINNDGSIEGNEGCAISTPIPIGLRDCFRQTVVDLMQLMRVIRGGLDLTGDGVPDLDPHRIYYAGQSLGAMYGTMFTAVEPAVRAAALNVGGAPGVEVARWSPAYRELTNDVARTHIPSLLNKGNTYD
jgi:pimeloyl-ACP methyl ester carboxylesterase